MSTVLEKARGAATFSSREFEVADYAEAATARFDWQAIEGEWGAAVVELNNFRSLEDDWDGDLCIGSRTRFD